MDQKRIGAFIAQCRKEKNRVCKINCVYLHRLFDTPIFRTKKCFRQYCE